MREFFRRLRGRGVRRLETGYFQREYLGRFVDDSEMMVAEFARARNCIDAMPADYSLDWPHVVGIDYGYNDAFAIVVLTMSPWAPAARRIQSSSSSSSGSASASHVKGIITSAPNGSSTPPCPAGGAPRRAGSTNGNPPPSSAGARK